MLRPDCTKCARWSPGPWPAYPASNSTLQWALSKPGVLVIHIVQPEIDSEIAIDLFLTCGMFCFWGSPKRIYWGPQSSNHHHWHPPSLHCLRVPLAAHKVQVPLDIHLFKRICFNQSALQVQTMWEVEPVELRQNSGLSTVQVALRIPRRGSSFACTFSWRHGLWSTTVRKEIEKCLKSSTCRDTSDFNGKCASPAQCCFFSFVVQHGNSLHIWLTEELLIRLFSKSGFGCSFSSNSYCCLNASVKSNLFNSPWCEGLFKEASPPCPPGLRLEKLPWTAFLLSIRSSVAP